jgi:hypothetical protein
MWNLCIIIIILLMEEPILIEEVYIYYWYLKAILAEWYIDRLVHIFDILKFLKFINVFQYICHKLKRITKQSPKFSCRVSGPKKSRKPGGLGLGLGPGPNPNWRLQYTYYKNIRKFVNETGKLFCCFNWKNVSLVHADCI